MPAKVDRDRRRTELAEAVWRLIADRGIEHASSRNVAAESQWTCGVSQIYFRDKDDLLDAAFDLVVEQTARFEGLAASGSVRDDIPPAALADHYYALAMRLSFEYYVDAESLGGGRAEAMVESFLASIAPPTAASAG